MGQEEARSYHSDHLLVFSIDFVEMMSEQYVLFAEIETVRDFAALNRT
jgi:hypothetical protein